MTARKLSRCCNNEHCYPAATTATTTTAAAAAAAATVATAATAATAATTATATASDPGLCLRPKVHPSSVQSRDSKSQHPFPSRFLYLKGEVKGFATKRAAAAIVGVVFLPYWNRQPSSEW